MSTAYDPHEITRVLHWPGRIKGERVWKVFTDCHFADGGELNVADVGPFPSAEAAQVCADMANLAGVEVITDDLVKRARRAYLSRVLK